MPVKGSWPFQALLTYPFDANAVNGGYFAPIDGENFRVAYDKYVNLNWSENL